MNHAKYVIEDQTGAEFLVIRDIGPWSQHPTVTNDAEWVVQDLHAKRVLPVGRRLLYYDSDRHMDELLHDGHGCFVGYKFLLQGQKEGEF